MHVDLTKLSKHLKLLYLILKKKNTIFINELFLKSFDIILMGNIKNYKKN